MNVVILGQSGSGKSTLGEALEDRLHIPHIASGDIARNLAADDPHIALALRQGQWAPEETMRDEIKRMLESAEAQYGGWILDGFPRDLAQLFCLMTWTPTLPTFVLLEITDWRALERLIERARPDDTPDAAARRLASFHDKTGPVIDMLEEGGVLNCMNADIPLEHQVGIVERLLT